MQTQTQREPKNQALPLYKIQGSLLAPRKSFRLPKKGILSQYPLGKKTPKTDPPKIEARNRIFTKELGELTRSILKETNPSRSAKIETRAKTHTEGHPEGGQKSRPSREPRTAPAKAKESKAENQKGTQQPAGTSLLQKEKKPPSPFSVAESPSPAPKPVADKNQDALDLEERVAKDLLAELAAKETEKKETLNIPDLIIEDFDYKAAGIDEKTKTAAEQQRQEIQKEQEKKAPQTSQSTKEKELPESIGSPQELSIGIRNFQEDYLTEEEGPSLLPENKRPEEKKRTSSSIQFEAKRQKDIAKPTQKIKEQSSTHSKGPSLQKKEKIKPPVDWLKYEWHPEANRLYYNIANIYKKSTHEEKDFAFLIEHIRKKAEASAAAIVLFNEEKTVYQRILDSGLDDITARNLYFGIEDAYVNPARQGKKIPLLHGDSRDFYFQKRFSSDFFHSTDYFTIHNLIPLGFDGYLLLFYRQKEEKKTIFADLQGLLRDTLPLVYSFAKQSWYASVNKGEMHGLLQRLIFESLRAASKGGTEAIWVYHINLISLLKSKGGYEKVQQIYKEMEKDIKKHPSVFFMQLLPHRFVIFAKSKEKLEIYKNELLRLCGEQRQKIEIRQSFYPSDGENLFNYLAPN